MSPHDDNFDVAGTGTVATHYDPDTHRVDYVEDASTNVDPTKLYWNWLGSTFTAALADSDPNRLIMEQRLAEGEDDFSYRKEYFYDPGGNRLALRESTYDAQEEAWNIWQITRYNYSYPVNRGGFDPDEASDVSTNFSGIEGEPDRIGGVAEVGTNWNGHGMDRLISYKVYRPNQEGFIHFAAYDYGDWHGNLSRKTEMGTGVPEEADLLAQPFRKTLRLRHLPGMMPGRRLLQDVHAQWWQPDAQACEASDPCPEWAFFESYAYDWQGRRIAKMHCADAGKFVAFNNFGDPGSSCKEGPIAISYDYDGAQVLVERRIPLGEEGAFVQPPGSKDRILSVYTWGATGLVQRVAGQEDLCPENDCTYQYLNDATGNCVGVVCAGGGSVGGSCSAANLYAVRFSRMDAWGNLISPVYLDGLPPALLVDDVDCTASTAEGCDPADGMPQEEALAGPYQYHGGDRYETDLIDMDKLLRPDGGQAAPGAGRSTGFVHVGVRYYEPATGRFLQHDPMFIDPTPFAWGQHNRWVYCANDPVNFWDNSGRYTSTVDLSAAIAIQAVLFGMLGYAVSQALIGAGNLLCMAADELTQAIQDGRRIKSFIDYLLDLLNEAMKAGDRVQIEELKKEIDEYATLLREIVEFLVRNGIDPKVLDQPGSSY